MSTNLNIEQGLLNANTLWVSNWSDLMSSADPGAYPIYTETIPAAGAARIDINFLANHPVMQKWLGARQRKTLRHYNFTVSWDAYEATMPLKRSALANDRTGTVERGITEFQKLQIAAKDKAVAALFDSASGAGPTCFDGTALFNASHPHGPAAAVQSNLAASTNLSHAALRAAEAAGQLIVHENGEPAKIRYTQLRVGPNLRRRAQELLSVDRVVVATAAGAFDPASAGVAAATRTNIMQNEYQLAVDDRVTTYFWTLIDTTKSAKSMILFLSRDAEAIARTSMDDERRFEFDEFTFGIEGDWGVAAGHWHTCYRGTGTG